MKTESSPGNTWQGLPLSPAQNREVLDYVQRRRRAGADPDTPELRAMLDDMLHPPELAQDEENAGRYAENACFAATHQEPDETARDEGDQTH
ncbi:MAG: hypothetical protein AB1437_14285 [Pseudomonadota bacterium]